MIRDFHELNAEYPIPRTILGEKRIKESNKRAIFILAIMIAFIILSIILCSVYKHCEYEILLIILLAFLILLSVIIFNNCKSIKYVKIEIPEYKPNFMSYLKGIDWNNYLIVEKWIKIIEQKRYYKTSTNILIYNHTIAKMELSEKPKINYSNLLSILATAISLTVVIIAIMKEHLGLDLKYAGNFRSFMLICGLIFFLILYISGFFIIEMRRIYSIKMNKYNELKRYIYAMLYIIHKGKEKTPF